MYLKSTTTNNENNIKKSRKNNLKKVAKPNKNDNIEVTKQHLKETSIRAPASKPLSLETKNLIEDKIVWFFLSDMPLIKTTIFNFDN